MNRKHAFTLPEVLASLAILGIVALLVLASIRSEENTAQLYNTQYDKVYEDVYTASKMVLTIDRKNALKFDSGESSADLRNAFADRLDVTSVWDRGNGWQSGPNDALSRIGADSANVSGITLSNGVSVGFVNAADLTGGASGLAATMGWNENALVGALAVDLNGTSPKNTYGSDQTLIPLYSEGVKQDIASNTIMQTAQTNVDCANMSDAARGIVCQADNNGNCACNCTQQDSHGVNLIYINGQCKSNCLDPNRNTQLNNPYAVVNYDEDSCFSCKTNASALCKAKGDNWEFYEDTCACVDVEQECPAGEIFSKEEGKCICPLTAKSCGGNELQPGVCACCADGMVVDENGECKLENLVCDNYKQANINRTGCECISSSDCMGNGYNSDTCECVCDATYGLQSNGAKNAAAQCICIPNSNGCTTPVSGVAGEYGYDEITNMCKCNCPLPFVWNNMPGAGAACVCSLQASDCAAQKAVLNNMTCRCDACPEGTISDGTTCVVDEDNKNDNNDDNNNGEDDPVVNVTNAAGCQSGDITIRNARELYNVRNNLSASYCLVADIDLADSPATKIPNYDEGLGWEPIWNFQGRFNGNGHTISNLYIYRSDMVGVGLFGLVQNSTITNVGLINPTVSGSQYVGSLIGVNYFNVNLSNSYATGVNVIGNGNYMTGGLVGSNEYYSTISNSYVTGYITSVSNYVGGIAGINQVSSLITKCISAADVYSDGVGVGGVVGSNFGNAETNNSYFTGKVTGQAWVGGVAGDGYTSSSYVRNSYSIGHVYGEGSIGGVQGLLTQSNVINSYSDSTVQDIPAIGENNGTATNVLALTTSQMQVSKTNNNIYKTWSSDIWCFNCGKYPVLKDMPSGAPQPSGATSCGTRCSCPSGSSGTYDACSCSIQAPIYVGLDNACLTCSQQTSEDTPLWNDKTKQCEACPSDKPYYDNGTCLACVDTMYPVQQEGKCVSCASIDPTKPYWNGTECIACPDGVNCHVGEGPVSDNCPVAVTLTKATPEGNCGAGYIAISSPAQLAAIGKCSNYPNSASYCLMNNISLSGYGSSYNYGEGWEPIDFFRGVFDGNNKEISGLYINRPTKNYIGLFGYVRYASIYNLGLVNVNVIGSQWVGGLVGYAYPVSISDSYVNGSVTGFAMVGGIIGVDENGDISNSHFSGDVIGDQHVGGIVGYKNYGSVSNSYATGNLNSYSNAGGIVGESYSVSVTNSYFTGMVYANSAAGGIIGDSSSDNISSSYAMGTISGNNSVGGIVGSSFRGNISNSYVTAFVAGDDYVGGIVGYKTYAGISNSYVIGEIHGNDSVGGIMGYSDSCSISNSYFSTQTGQSKAVGDGSNVASVALTTEQMQKTNNETYTGWSTDIWCFGCASYPVLKNMPAGAPDATACATQCSTCPSDANNKGYPNCVCSVNASEYEANQNICVYHCPDGSIGEHPNCDCSEYTGFEVYNYDSNSCITCFEKSGQVAPVWDAEQKICTACPSQTPFYDSTEGSCVTCAAYNSRTPFWDSDNHECKSCADADLTKPYWNNETSACEVCPDATPYWNGVACMSCENTLYPVKQGSSCVSCASIDPTKPYWNGTECIGENDDIYDVTCDTNGVCRLNDETPDGYCGQGFIAITTAGQLAAIGVDANYSLGASYCLMQNIDLSAFGSGYNYGEGWKPIGDYKKQFAGVFDGNGKEISGLYINRPTWDYVGLFGVAASIKYSISNLRLVNVNITGNDYVGGIVGEGGVISNSYVTGNVTGNNYVGGMIGLNFGSMSNSYATCSVIGNDYVGGLIGCISSASISNSYATGDVTGYNYVGGIAGNNFGSMSNSYATGDVVGNDDVGGIVGYNSDDIYNSYSTGAVTGNDDVGGIVGCNYGYISDSYTTSSAVGNSGVGGIAGYNMNDIYNSYSTGTVTGNYDVGGIVGYNNAHVLNSYTTSSVVGNSSVGGVAGYNTSFASVSNSYFNTETAGQTKAVGDGSDVASAALTTEQMQKTNNETYIDWSIEDWCFGCASYPVLKNMPEGAPDARFCATSCDKCPDNSTGELPSCTCTKANAEYVDNNVCVYNCPEEASGDWFNCDCSNVVGRNMYDYITNTCVSCAEYGADAPIWNDSMCITCAEATSQETPYWNGTECVALPDGYEYDEVIKLTEPTSEGNCGAGYIAIYSAQQLAKIGKDEKYPLSASYCLMNNINLGNYSTNVSGGWTPIGNNTNAFTGTFDGNNKKISGLYIYRPSSSYQGLFGYVDGGIITKLGVFGVNIKGGSYTGGLVGYTKNSNITNSYATGNVTSAYNNVGGLVGLNRGNYSRCFASVNVTGKNYVGGLIGYDASSPSYSYAAGNVTGEQYVGGLVGYSGSIIHICYATGHVTGNQYTGGLIGDGSDSDWSYYDKDTTGQSDNDKAIGYSTAALKTTRNPLSIYYDTWPYDVWCFNCGDYPVLKNMPEGAPDATSCNACSCPSDSVGEYSNEAGTAYPTCRCLGENNKFVYDAIENECMACADVDEATPYWTGTGCSISCENELYPVQGENICYACGQVDETKPYWNGTECTAAPDNMECTNTGVCTLKDKTPEGYCGEGYIAISYPAQLAAIGKNYEYPLDASYCLMNNISLSGYATGEGWEPIGNNTNKFAGTFDGNGKEISGLYINRPSSDNQGLFGYVAPRVTISNLGLVDVNVTGNSYTGSILGRTDGSTTSIYVKINNVYATGSVVGSSYIGGLVGYGYGYSKISNSYFNGTVTGNANYYVGGIVGLFSYGTSIDNCYAIGSVTGKDSHVGGIVGYSNGYISKCAFIGDVTGYNYVGGIVGFNSYYSVSNSYATGSVTGKYYVGGIVGYYYNYYSVSNSYATSSVTGNSNVGGIIGYGGSSSITNSYFNTETTGQAKAVGNSSDEKYNYTALTTEQMKAFPSETVYTGWSNDIWCFDCNDYPVLHGMPKGAPDASWCSYDCENCPLYSTGEHPSCTCTDANATYSESKNLCIYTCPENTTGEYPNCICSANAGNEGYSAAENICMACASLDVSKPVWNGNACVSCTQATSEDTPYWNGTACVACPEGTECSDGVVRLTGPTDKGYCDAGYIAIYSPEQMARIGVDENYPLDDNYCLMNNINISRASINYTYTKGWTPIGTYTSADENNPFTGIFDGNGNEISNLYIKNNGKNRAGLFGYITGTVKNLGVVDAIIQNNAHYAGIVAAHAGQGSIFENVYAKGSVKAQAIVGGLIGYSYAKTIKDSYAEVDVTATQNSTIGTYSWSDSKINGTGGLIGYSYYNYQQSGTIKNCHATGNVTGTISVGGFIGTKAVGISESYATGDVQGVDNVGGFIGYANSGGGVSKCYSTGNVKLSAGASNRYVGGFVGNGRFGSISNCYSTGNVEGDNAIIGGFAGYGDSISSSYSTGNVVNTGSSGNAGGFVGYTDISSGVGKSYSTGNVTASGLSAGGFVGKIDVAPNTSYIGAGDYSSYAGVQNCYSTGDINSSATYTGGFAGTAYKSGVKYSYTLSHINSYGEHVGAFIAMRGDADTGEYQGASMAAFYNTDIQIEFPAVAIGSDDGIYGLPTEDLMVSKNNYNQYSTWDANIWCFNCGIYPLLKNMPTGAPDTSSCDFACSCPTGSTGTYGTCNCATAGTTTPFYNIVDNICESCAIHHPEATYWNGNRCVVSCASTVNPVNKDGECMSCTQATSAETPYWNGTECVACPDNMTCNDTVPKLIGETPEGNCGAGYIAITSAGQLALIGINSNYPLNGKYCLVNNISLAEFSSSLGDGSGWNPIGNYALNNSNKFTGTFDGNGKTISDLYINRANSIWLMFANRLTTYQGLFGYIENATIKNLNMMAAEINAVNIAGIIAAYNKGGTISNVSVSGVINVSNSAGGVVATNEGGTIINASVDIESTGSIGGVVGYNNDGTILDCSSTGTIKSGGGVVSTNGAKGIIRNCHTSVNVESGSGFADSNSGEISYSYATGKVGSGAGFVGTNNKDANISYCYHTGDVGGSSVGSASGFVQTNYGKISSCFATGGINGYNGGGFVGSNGGTYNYYDTDQKKTVYKAYDAEIRDCYYNGRYKINNTYSYNQSSYSVGGFVGQNAYGAKIINSYTTGSVSGSLSYRPDATGGFVGKIVGNDSYGYGTISNSYYNPVNMSRNIDSVGVHPEEYTTQVLGLTQQQMSVPKKSNNPYASWDESKWCLTCGSLPQLKDMPEGAPAANSCGADCACPEGSTGNYSSCTCTRNNAEYNSMTNECVYTCPYESAEGGEYPKCDCSANVGSEAFDSVNNICTSCDAISTDKPIWNGTECISCAALNMSSPAWDDTSGACSTCSLVTGGQRPKYKEICPEGTVLQGTSCVLPESHKCLHKIGSLCIVEKTSMYNEETNPQGGYTSIPSANETDELVAQYHLGAANTTEDANDSWAGAMKYCQDRGLRLPTPEEIMMLSKIVYDENENLCDGECTIINEDYTGKQGEVCCSRISITDVEMYYDPTHDTEEQYDDVEKFTDWLTDSTWDTVFVWTSAGKSETQAYRARFGYDRFMFYPVLRTITGTSTLALCVTDINEGYVQEVETGCYACPDGAQYDEATDSCKCMQGYYGDGDVACYPCDSNATTASIDSPDASYCMCNQGYYGDGLICDSCSSNSYCPGGENEPVICEEGTFYYQGECKTICEQNNIEGCITCATYNSETPDWDAVSGTCYSACPEGSVADANGVCKLPATLENGNCGAGYIAIASAEDLAKIGVDTNYSLGDSYCLMNDISLSAYSAGEGWTPIGDNTNKFTGAFDGNGRNISGLYINRSTQNYVGLFGYIDSSATISNLGLVNVNVTGNDYVGGMVGYSAAITKATTTSVGGVTVNSFCGTVVSCANISNSYVSGSVTGNSRVGGIAGDNRGNIFNSYATGNISGADFAVGGISGGNSGSISNSYSTCDVVANSDVGGITGFCGCGSISNSYAIGAVTGESYVAGIIGYGSNLSASYYNKETTGQTKAVGNGSDVVSAALTTEQMQVSKGSSNPYSTWDDSIWCFNCGAYPQLKNMPAGAPSANSCGMACTCGGGSTGTYDECTCPLQNGTYNPMTNSCT